MIDLEDGSPMLSYDDFPILMDIASQSDARIDDNAWSSGIVVSDSGLAYEVLTDWQAIGDPND